DRANRYDCDENSNEKEWTLASTLRHVEHQPAGLLRHVLGNLQGPDETGRRRAGLVHRSSGHVSDCRARQNGWSYGVTSSSTRAPEEWTSGSCQGGPIGS